MQKRLSTRDWILYILLTLLVLLLLLVMYQVDRQWRKLDDMERALSEQAQSLRQFQRSPGAFSASPNQHNDPENISPAFQRAYAATQQPDYAEGGWSLNAFALNLKTITPLISSDIYASQVQNQVLESLLTRNPDTLNWEGLIAKDWQVSDDGLTITFQLRQDVNFSDGQLLTSEDVVFSYEFIMTESIRAPGLRTYLEKIKSVTALGTYEVEFVFAEPYFEALEVAGATIAILPKHFYESYLQNPEEYNESKGILLGSGPYRLTDPKGWTPDQGSVELVRNERYWGQVAPSYDRIFWRIIQNDSARLTTYRNGEIDAYTARAIEYAELKNDPQIQEKSQNFAYTSPVAGYSYLGWNQKRNGKATHFADKRVRQAMTYLTDRKRIIDEIFLGYAEPAISPFSPRSKQHDPQLKPRPFNLKKAKALLKEAGYEDRDKDGVLENTQGEAFSFKLTYFEGSDDTKRLVLLLKDIYARAGIILEPTPQEWPVMIESIEKKDFDSVALGWSSGIETDIYQIFHSSQAQTNGDNFVSYISPKLDKVIEEARATVDESKRIPLWQEAERILYEDQPYTFLFRRQTLAFINKRIKNLQLTKLGLNRQFLPVETYIPAPLQRHSR